MDTPELIPEQYRSEYIELKRLLGEVSIKLAEAELAYHEAIIKRIQFVETLRNTHQLHI